MSFPSPSRSCSCIRDAVAPVISSSLPWGMVKWGTDCYTKFRGEQMSCSSSHTTYYFDYCTAQVMPVYNLLTFSSPIVTEDWNLFSEPKAVRELVTVKRKYEETVSTAIVCSWLFEVRVHTLHLIAGIPPWLFGGRRDFRNISVAWVLHLYRLFNSA